MRGETMGCPNRHGPGETKKLKKSMRFRGVDIMFEVEHDVCALCGLEVGSVDQSAATQRAISDAYRNKVGLLTGEEIRMSRIKMGWTQADLAEQMGVGIASIKRWEGGLIQTKSMDNALRMALQGERSGDTYTGNRTFSIPRVKLVLRYFESDLKKRLLVRNDKMLYAAKYLWYADMLAFRELGSSMTGATYARLPLGPQLNNYRDLVDEIMRADEACAEPLTPEERRIITRVSRAFPNKYEAYQAAHEETILKKYSIGTILPYPIAEELKGL